MPGWFAARAGLDADGCPLVCGTRLVVDWCPLAIRPVVAVVSKIVETTVSKIVEAMTTLQVYKPDSV